VRGGERDEKGETSERWGIGRRGRDENGRERWREMEKEKKRKREREKERKREKEAGEWRKVKRKRETLLFTQKTKLQALNP